MSTASPNPLDAAAQAMLDDLYWNTTSTATSLGQQFGVATARVSRLVTPLAVGIDCWWCRAALTWVSRSERSSQRPTSCHGCGALTSSRATDPSLQVSDAVIMVTTTGQRSPRDLSTDISDGVEALVELGLRWSGRFEAVDIRIGPLKVRQAMLAIGVETIVVSSIRALGMSQGDAFGAFRLLLQTDLRVITARDIIWGRFDGQGDYERHSHRWAERVSVGYGFPADRSDGGRSWADEYRTLLPADTYDDDEEYARGHW